MSSARYSSTKGRKATDEVSIDLVCAAGAACGGVCTDLALDGLNCGSCGHSCDRELLRRPEPARQLSADALILSEGFDTCTAACESFGETCAENACEAGITTRSFNNLMECEDDFNGDNNVMACDQPDVGDRGKSYRCCCTDTQ